MQVKDSQKLLTNHETSDETPSTLGFVFFYFHSARQKRTECLRENALQRISWRGGLVHPCTAVRSINIYLFLHSQSVRVSDCLSEWTQEQVKRELIIHDCLLTCSPPLKHAWTSQGGGNSEIIYFSADIDCVRQRFSICRGSTFLLSLLLRSGHLTGHLPTTLQTQVIFFHMMSIQSTSEWFMTDFTLDPNLQKLNNWDMPEKKKHFPDSPLFIGLEQSR